MGGLGGGAACARRATHAPPRGASLRSVFYVWCSTLHYFVLCFSGPWGRSNDTLKSDEPKKTLRSPSSLRLSCVVFNVTLFCSLLERALGAQ